jgi:hypothetical protein
MVTSNFGEDSLYGIILPNGLFDEKYTEIVSKPSSLPCLLAHPKPLPSIKYMVREKKGPLAHIQAILPRIAG